MDCSKSSYETCLGNTKPKQVSPAKHWLFTYFYDESTFNEKHLCDLLSSSSNFYIFGYEVCPTTNKRHLQGYVEFKTKLRPASMFDKTIHWEKRKGNKDQNIEYCKKEGNYVINGIHCRPLQIIDVLYPWQQHIVDLIKTTPDDRTINWFWESLGNFGKSALCKYICSKFNALICSGKGSDIKYGIIKYHESKGVYPDIVLIDIPKCLDDKYVSLTTIEEIKNGLFFSGKYESEMCMFNPPHIIVFSNRPPDKSKMSADRWNIVNLEEAHE